MTEIPDRSEDVVGRLRGAQPGAGRAGLQPLAVNLRLETAAAVHADDMAAQVADEASGRRRLVAVPADREEGHHFQCGRRERRLGRAGSRVTPRDWLESRATAGTSSASSGDRRR